MISLICVRNKILIPLMLIFILIISKPILLSGKHLSSITNIQPTKRAVVISIWPSHLQIIQKNVTVLLLLSIKN